MVDFSARTTVSQMQVSYNGSIWTERLNAVAHMSVALAIALSAGPISAMTTEERDPKTGLLSWTWHHQGVSIQLVQRLPDQTRAFFLGRGFQLAGAELIATSCVFQTIFRNDGRHSVSYDLNEWAVLMEGQKAAPQTRETWDHVWLEQETDQSARIAFRWSLLPSVQTFEPGDYNWGMISFGVPPGTQFDVSLVIHTDNKPVFGKIQTLICAEDGDGTTE